MRSSGLLSEEISKCSLAARCPALLKNPRTPTHRSATVRKRFFVGQIAPDCGREGIVYHLTENAAYWEDIMIFVSYSHADEQWRKRFEMMAKPLSRVIPMDFWSDKQIRAGEWETQIKAAMDKAEAVVFLVSPAFLASDYITNTEVPYFLKAHKERGLKIFWAYLEPCDLKHPPGKHIKAIQAMTLDGNLKAMSSMTDWQWKEAMVKGCDMIDEDCVKPLEKPLIHPDARKKPSLPRVAKDFPLLAKPARRDVEVLVYAGKWWRQAPVKSGSCKTTIHVGREETKSGTEFKVIALTTESPLTDPTYLNLPDHRTKSEEIVVKRA
jgi:TIR domain